jgi:hypothetical protein
MAHNRKQLRSGTVVLGGVGLLAAALTACSSDPDKRCVDRDSYDVSKGYKVVSDKDCKTTGGTGGSFTKPGGSGGSSGGSSYNDGNSGGSHGGVSRGGFGGGSGSSGG